MALPESANPPLEPQDSFASEETDHIVYDVRRWAKGTFIAGGVSGVVELMQNGNIVKSAWPEDEESREDIAREALAYTRLRERFGAHRRFVRHISYNEVDNSIIMEHIKHGSLREYLKVHHNDISQAQRRAWILALAEGMGLLHAAGIIHCDFSPRNMLLSEELELKVADFGCVSIDGSRSTAGGSARFYPPRASDNELIDFKDDLFALGSSIFEVFSGKPPFADLSTFRVRTLFEQRQFPDLTGIPMHEIINDCWHFRARSAHEVYERALEMHRTSSS